MPRKTGNQSGGRGIALLGPPFRGTDDKSAAEGFRLVSTTRSEYTGILRFSLRGSMVTETVTLLRVVVASPSDVPSERDAVSEIVEELNRGIARDKKLRIDLYCWETDAHPGFHVDGPQGLIDNVLRIQDCDLLIGIFWKKFGTPTKDAGSGTEHEFRVAYEAWKKHRKPQIMVYFNQRAYTPKDKAEADQWGLVLNFKENYPQQGLWWPYRGRENFQTLLRQHLSFFVRNHKHVVVSPDRGGGSSPEFDDQNWLDEQAAKLEEDNERLREQVSFATADVSEEPLDWPGSPERSPDGSYRDPTQQHVVVLVHGIRDFALWQTTIRSTFEEEGFKAEATNYGRFNLLQFLLPLPYFRKKAISTIWKQMRVVKQNNEGSLISVVAHSFGTFVIANLMQENFDIKFHRVIFCGSVVRYGFPFEQIQNRFTQPIINEVGTRDGWPAIAESITLGYGSAGTYGFRRPLVRDRWHNGARHGFFLNAEFCKKFWSPFLKDGTFVAGAAAPESPHLWLQFLSIVKIKYLLGSLILLFLINSVTDFEITDLLISQFDRHAQITNAVGDERSLPSAWGDAIQRALCLSPNVGPASFGPETRAAIELFRASPKGRRLSTAEGRRPGPAGLTREEIAFLQSQKCDASCYRNAYEYYTFGSPIQLRSLLNRLAKVMPGAVRSVDASRLCDATVRDLISGVQMSKNVPGDGTLTPSFVDRLPPEL
jgi:hypothetical protein